MPELLFKGKEFVYNHHLAVPHHPLVPDPGKGIGDGKLDGNLIIHGDNLLALKALLPRYAGKVDCIFIDPPYNTGNEGWSYNDNVNSPLMQAWLKSNPVGIEDGLRHDKWLAMMWPRLRLLRELLSEAGSIWITLDDNELHRGRSVLDEIFGKDNFVACFVWRKVDSPNDNKVTITPDHEFVVCYAKEKPKAKFSPLIAPDILDAYSAKDAEGLLYRDRLLKKNGKNSLRRDRPTMYFPIRDPDGSDVYPIHEDGEEARWAAGVKAVERHRKDGTLIWKKREKLGVEVWEPYTREYAPSDPTRPFPTIWADLPTMRQAKAMLRDVFGKGEAFSTPKPVELIGRILDLIDDHSATVLDSFAGSGTTAHAVLAANQRDGGDRRFILVECEDYADTLTAERVRRVIKGYQFKGTQREELHRESLSYSSLKKADKLLTHVASIENLEGHRFDSIEKKVKDGELIVAGEKSVTERTEGLGGSFTYCTLGPALELDKLLSGASLPSFDAVASLVFHMATNLPLPAGKSTKTRGGGRSNTWAMGARSMSG